MYTYLDLQFVNLYDENLEAICDRYKIQNDELELKTISSVDDFKEICGAKCSCFRNTSS